MTLGNDDGAGGQAFRQSIDDELRALTEHDVSPERAARTRARCLARLSARTAARPALTVRGGTGASPVAWLEPVAALSACLIYLAAALQAATVLMSLGPKP
jgi:hypothetical protein